MFDNTTAIKSQTDMLDQGVYFGRLNAYGHPETGVPGNNNYYVKIEKYNSNYAKITLSIINGSNIYVCSKSAGIWQDWDSYILTSNLASISFLKNVYELTSSNLDNTITNETGIAIGFGIFGDRVYISFDIIWTRLQHRFDAAGFVQTRAKYGNNAWSSWK